MEIMGRVSFENWGWAEELKAREKPLRRLRKLLEELEECSYDLPDIDQDSELPRVVAGAIDDQMEQDGYVDLDVNPETVLLQAHLPLTDQDGESVIMQEDMNDLINERVTWIADGGRKEVTLLRDHLARWVAQLTAALAVPDEPENPTKATT